MDHKKIQRITKSEPIRKSVVSKNALNVTFGNLIQVTNTSRLPPTLTGLRYKNNPYTQKYIWYRNTVDECMLAINPTNPDNMIITTHQDRFKKFLGDIVLYSIDGGETWNESNLVLSRLQGATVQDASDDYEVASDPYVVFDDKGIAYMSSVSYNVDNNYEEGVIITKSTDGGRNWDRLVEVTRDDGMVNYQDKQVHNFDKYRPNNVYVTWTNYIGSMFPANTDIWNPIIFQKSTDGGASWSAPSKVSDCKPLDTVAYPKSDNVDFGPWNNMIHSLPENGHPLLISSMIMNDQFEVITNPKQSLSRASVFRSEDEGNTWTEYYIETNIVNSYPFDPVPKKDGTYDYIMGNGTYIETVVNYSNGKIYAIYGNNKFKSASNVVGIVLSKSDDGGKTWSNSVRADNPNYNSTHAFTPSIAVLSSGHVGVMYYDMRNYNPNNDNPQATGVLNCDVWLRVFDADLTFIQEIKITNVSFDLRQAMYRNDAEALFIGDYVKLCGLGNTFYCSYCATNPTDARGKSQLTVKQFTKDTRVEMGVPVTFPKRQSIYFRKITIN